MKKILLVSLLAILVASLCYAQSPTFPEEYAPLDKPPGTIEPDHQRPLNNLYINLFGDASLFSFNYERLFPLGSTLVISGKAGIGYNEALRICIWGICPPPNGFATIPHHITVNWGKGYNFFEFGLGGTSIIGNTNQHYFLYTILGYRLMPLRSNKTSFRIFGILPFSGFSSDDIILFPFGISLGVNF